MRFPRIRRVWFQWVMAGAMATSLGCSGGDDAHPASRTKTVSPPVAAPVAKLDPPPVAPMVATPELPEQPALPTPEPLVIPDGYRARMKLARQLGKDGRSDDAEAVYEKAAEAEPTRSAPRIEIARLRIDAKDVAGARKYAEAAVELEPGSSGAWNTLGRVELMDGDKLAAVAAFEKSSEANPDNSFAWNNLGLVLSQLGRWEEAVAALERATGGDKPEPYMWNNLGQAYEHTDQIELARAAYRQGAKAGSQTSVESLARLDGVTVGTQAKWEGGEPGVDVTPVPAPGVGSDAGVP